MTDNERSLASYYDAEGAERAERALAPGRIEARNRFLATYAREGMRTLEVGTGGGQDAAAFVAAGLDAHGIDLSPVFARFAAAGGAHVVNATARALPYRAAAFGIVWSMSVLMHIPDDGIADALDEIRRVMTPGAVACTGVWTNSQGPTMFDGAHGTRFFANRTEAAWRVLLERIGTIERYEIWDPESDGFTYHWAVVRNTL